MNEPATVATDAVSALLRVIEYLVLKDAVLGLLYAGIVYILVYALIRALGGGRGGSSGTPAQPGQPSAPPPTGAPAQPPANPPPDPPPTTAAPNPELSLGAVGPAVNQLQQILGVTIDGEFGPDTDSAVRAYQATHGLDVDGDVGADTWAALLANKPAVAQPTGVAISSDTINKVLQAASASNLAHYAWADRGVAPSAYIRGVAVSFANAYAKWKQGSSATAVMAAAASGDGSIDALSWYAAFFSKLGMSNSVAGGDTLRHTFVLLTGLGMRESSGIYCTGRDMSASNVTADTAEAGLFQQSWNSRVASPELPKLFAQYSANPEGFKSIFADGIQCSSGNLQNYGDGDGAAFQALCKSCPDFAVEAAAVGLRTIRQHWGPIDRQEAEIRPEADQLFQQVQAIVDTAPIVTAPTVPAVPTAPVSTTPNGIPAQLAVMRDLVARSVHAENDNPEIMTWPGFIAMKFSSVAGLGDYCAGYTHDTIAWCGLTMAFCLAKAGIMPAFTKGDDLKSFLWAFGWMDSGWGTTIWRWDHGSVYDAPAAQSGDILVFDWSYTGGARTNPGQGHVTMYDHADPNSNRFWVSGGNQGNHLCSTASEPMINCVAILRPPAPTAA